MKKLTLILIITAASFWSCEKDKDTYSSTACNCGKITALVGNIVTAPPYDTIYFICVKENCSDKITTFQVSQYVLSQYYLGGDFCW